MADTEYVAEDITEVSSFLLMVLEEGNDLRHQNSTTDKFKDKGTTYLELVEVTTKMLEAFYEVCEDEDDKLCWENLTSLYRLWKSKTRVTSYELRVQIHELQVQIHKLRVQIHK